MGDVKQALRPDIEGLRAVAVLAVVLYHSAVTALGGGFVGVDIFFVISGFLITGLLLTELSRNDSIDLRSFWARRARRLLPAAAVVLVATAIASAIILPPLQSATAMRDAAAAALYAANWRFAYRETAYLTDTEVSPVLHFWSLGVEEQFYLVWPVLLVGLALFSRRSGRRPLRIIFCALAVIWIGSFALSYWLTDFNQPLAFFGLPTRAWQLASGGLLAASTLVIARIPVVLRAGLGWLGLAGILASVVLLRDSSAVPYPGVIALLPTAGAAALIASGCGAVPRGGPGWLLGNPLLLWIGRLSYSWYLWHWLPLVLAPVVLERAVRPVEALGIAALTLGISWLSYRLVEQPVRYAPVLVRRPGLALAMCGLLALVPGLLALGLGSLTAPGATSSAVVVAGAGGVRTSVTLQKSPLEASRDFNPLLSNGCQVGTGAVKPLPGCVFGTAGSGGRVVLFGDSHASQWFPGLKPAADAMDASLDVRTKNGCSPADVTLYREKKRYVSCDTWRETVLRDLETEPADVVVVTGLARAKPFPVINRTTGRVVEGASASETFMHGLTRTLERLRATGTRVVVLRDSPRMAADPDPVGCLAATGDATRCDRPRSAAVSEPAPDLDVARSLGVETWDLTDAVCDATTCRAVVGNTIAWYDDGHLSATFAAGLTDRFTELLRKAPR